MESPTMATETRDRISAWILEFLLRNPDAEELAKRALAVMPIPASDARLKRAVLLRTVECEVSDAVLTEATLEALELLAALDDGGGAWAAMSAAYRAVAVECTVRPLVGAGGRSCSKYLAAVERIWRVRVGRLERKSGLLTGDLRQWRDEVEAAVWDAGACARLAAMNTRNDAVAAVRAYLKEAWALVGPSAVGWGVRLREEEDDFRVSRKGEEPCVRGTDLGGVITMAAKAGLLGLGGGGGGGDQGSDDVVGDGAGLADSPAGLVVNDTPASNVRGQNKRLALHKGLRAPARISDIEDSDTDTANIPTPEVNKVQEALKSSALELKMAVTDPLPAAMQTAETVISDLATKNVVHEHPLVNSSAREAGATGLSVDKSTEPVEMNNVNVGNPSCSHQNDVQPQSLMECNRTSHNDANHGNPSCSHQNDVPQRSVMENNSPAHNDANLGNPSCSNQNDVPRQSLMERNNTAHTLEWDDLTDGSPTPKRDGKSRLHLPSPKKRVVSPLKEYKPTKVSKRRTVKRWTLLEEDTLRTGVQKYGKGNWKLILNSYRQVFDERTEVDLKDKWRNMTK